MNTSQHLTVISLIGPSGGGKSTAIKTLSADHEVLQERYMELNCHQLDNRLLLSKWAYIQYWFDGVHKARANGQNLLLTDRCPLDTCAYVLEGRSALLDILKIAINELETLSIRVRTILITADFGVLQTRINRRLADEPRRHEYNEADISHNRRAFDFYSENTQQWDRLINSTQKTESELLLLLKTTIMDLTRLNK